MSPAALRALLLLLAFVGAMTAPDPGASPADLAGRSAAGTASPLDRAGSDRSSGWHSLALPGDAAPASLAGWAKPDRGPTSAGGRVEPIPQPRRAVRVLDPLRCGAFAPGQLPEALAFLRMNGSASANGVGT